MGHTVTTIHMIPHRHLFTLAQTHTRNENSATYSIKLNTEWSMDDTELRRLYDNTSTSFYPAWHTRKFSNSVRLS